MGPPVVDRAFVAHARASGPVGIGIDPFEAQFVQVRVTNDLGAAVAAEDVRGWLAFNTVDGEVLGEGLEARWTHTEQPADRSDFARLDDPTLNETRIPVGATRYLDVCGRTGRLPDVDESEHDAARRSPIWPRRS